MKNTLLFAAKTLLITVGMILVLIGVSHLSDGNHGDSLKYFILCFFLGFPMVIYGMKTISFE